MKVLDLTQSSPVSNYEGLVGAIDIVYGSGAHRDSILMDIFMRLNVGLDRGTILLENAKNLQYSGYAYMGSQA